MKYRNLEQDLIKELLVYDEHTGRFTWLKVSTKNQVRVGDDAGSKTSRGYKQIKISGFSYKAHRLAWTYMYGDIPEGFSIDHINGVKDDNRIENLRLAKGQADQNQNAAVRKNNTSGYVGVVWGRKENKWKAQLTYGKNKHHLGCFNTAEEANKVRVLAKAAHHSFNPIQRTT